MIALAAVTENFVMGQKSSSTLPWPHQSDDLKWFKENTLDRNVLVGPKTYESIRHLKRRNFQIVANSDREFPLADNILSVSDHSLITSNPHNYKDSIVIGGAWVYSKLIPLCDTLYLTVFDFKVDLGEDALYFPFSMFELKSLFKTSKMMDRKIENGIIYEFTK